jgi:hypothetical protein
VVLVIITQRINEAMLNFDGNAVSERGFSGFSGKEFETIISCVKIA